VSKVAVITSVWTVKVSLRTGAGAEAPAATGVAPLAAAEAGVGTPLPEAAAEAAGTGPPNRVGWPLWRLHASHSRTSDMVNTTHSRVRRISVMRMAWKKSGNDGRRLG
jgi:hypothetical protein